MDTIPQDTADHYKDQNIKNPNKTEWAHIFTRMHKSNNNTLAFDLRWKLLLFAHPIMYRLIKIGTVGLAQCQICHNKTVESHGTGTCSAKKNNLQ